MHTPFFSAGASRTPPSPILPHGTEGDLPLLRTLPQTSLPHPRRLLRRCLHCLSSGGIHASPLRGQRLASPLDCKRAPTPHHRAHSPLYTQGIDRPSLECVPGASTTALSQPSPTLSQRHGRAVQASAEGGGGAWGEEGAAGQRKVVVLHNTQHRVRRWDPLELRACRALQSRSQWALRSE